MRARRWHMHQRSATPRTSLIQARGAEPARSARRRGCVHIPNYRVVGHGVAAHPLPICWQHHAFFGSAQPACQFANPALQSKGTGAGGGGGQPLPWLWQHHTFFGSDQPACQFAKPALQSYGIGGGGGGGGGGGCGCVVCGGGLGVVVQPLPACSQHQAFLLMDHPVCQFAYPALQSYGNFVVNLVVLVVGPGISRMITTTTRPRRPTPPPMKKQV